jgi:hypothetical protein
MTRITKFASVLVMTTALGRYAAAQDAPNREAASSATGSPGADALARDAKLGLPPRATPGDYQSHTQAGSVTLAAEFTGHSVPTPEAILSTEDYVIVEVGLFGPPDARLALTFGDFSLRVNGKKMATPAQPYGLVFESLKDPEWEPPASASKSKTGIATGGQGQGDPPPVPPKMPIELKRAMQQRVQKASLPEGERGLPEAGLLYFPYRGKADGIHTIELIYAGAAGKATLALHP